MNLLVWLILSSPPGGAMPVKPNVVPMPSMNVPAKVPAPVAGVGVAATPAEVAQRVEAALLRGELAPLADHLPDHEIRHVEAHPGRDLPLIMKLPADRLVDVIERLRASGKILSGFEDMQCDETCCKSQRTATPAGAVSLEEVCTEPTVDGRRAITLFGVRFG